MYRLALISQNTARCIGTFKVNLARHLLKGYVGVHVFFTVNQNAVWLIPLVEYSCAVWFLFSELE